MILGVLNQRVDLHRLGRTAVGGDLQVVETFADLQALVQGKQEQMSDHDGREVTANAVVFLAADAPIDTSRETWRIEWDGRHWEVVAVFKEIDAATGLVHHIKLGIR